MPKCTHPSCNAQITFAVNLKSLKTVPLVPHEPDYEKAVRYRISGERQDGVKECERDDYGDWMSHFANCPGANRFGKGKSR